MEEGRVGEGRNRKGRKDGWRGGMQRFNSEQKSYVNLEQSVIVSLITETMVPFCYHSSSAVVCFWFCSLLVIQSVVLLGATGLSPRPAFAALSGLCRG